jgi:hypothetical protein
LRSRALSAKRPCTSELLRIYLLGTPVNKPGSDVLRLG